MQSGRGTDIQEKACIRCTKPAQVEKKTMASSQYMFPSGKYCLIRRGPVESVVYLCHSCAEYELSAGTG